MRRALFQGTRDAVALATLGLALVTAACGGTPPPEAKAPEAAPPPKPVARNVAPAGQRVGIAAGAAGGAELSGDAKSTYDRGFQAWMSGNLQAAKTAFTDAAQKAPAAGGPRYSLGCVLERLGDTQGALDAYRAAYTASSKFEVAMGAYALLLAQSGHGTDAEQFLSDKLAQNPNSPALMTYKAEVKSIEGD